MLNKMETIIRASVAIEAKRQEVATARMELNELLTNFKKLVKTRSMKVVSTPEQDSAPNSKRKPSRVKSNILKMLRKQDMRFSEMSEKTGMSKSSIFKALNQLIEEKSIRKVSYGVYGLTRAL